MKVIIIDYGMGNVASARKAFQKVGARAVVSRANKDIDSATHLVLPGVGAFGDGMDRIRKLGLVEILTRKVVTEKIPFLGICLGMQLLAETGYEFGEHPGLGWIRGDVIKFKSPKLRLPHVGWNEIKTKKNAVLFKNIPDKNFYFVHSYYMKPKDKNIITATCAYGDMFAASLQYKNIFATQFHPEKSQASGLKLLENFLNSNLNSNGKD